MRTNTEFTARAGRWECHDCKKRFFTEASTYRVAKLLEDAERLDEAEGLYRESLVMNRAAPYKTASDVAISLDCLAGLLEKMNRPGEAEPLYRESLELRRGIPPEKPGSYIPTTLENLARVLEATGRYDQAEVLYREHLGLSRQSGDRNCMTECLDRLILLLKKKKLQGHPVEDIEALEADYVAKSEFISPEGFARVTRDNHTDICLVRNQELPAYKVSLAFDLDDVEPVDPFPGKFCILSDRDAVEFLGTPEDYFIPKAPLWDLLPELVRIAPKDCGLLPLVRAAEKLKTLPPEERVAQTTAVLGATIADYRHRRQARVSKV